MSAFLRPVLQRWRLSALVASLAMLAIAHAFETFGGLAPCTLCLRAREVYWLAAALALVFAAGVALAVYHAGVEWKFWPGPTACSGGGAIVDASQMTDLLQGARIKPPACDEAAWVFLGLSMAGWNALASLALTVLSGLAVAHERRTTR